jgi:hypothetical protein
MTHRKFSDSSAVKLAGCALSAALLLSACATAPQQASSTAAPVAAAPAAVAPGTSEQETLRTMMRLQDRLDRVASPLLVNNRMLCKGSARKLLGFSAKNKYSYSSELADVAEKDFGFDDRLRVTGVLEGSGAARAGIQRGDLLIAADDQPMPQGENAERNAAGVLAPLVQKGASVKLTLLRNGASLSVNVPLTYACAFSVELGNADIVNTYSDGRRVLVTRGMINAVQSDEELAYVIARDMAHNILKHAAAQHITATVGGIIDNLIRVHPDLSSMTGMAGMKPYSQDMDADADRLSLYLIARAGYRIDGAPAFWQRMSDQHPATELNGYTALHPMNTRRFFTLDKTVSEIKSKQAAKRPLVP